MNLSIAPSQQARPAHQGSTVGPTQVIETADDSLALRVSRCDACQRAVFPPAEVCPFCAAGPCTGFPLSGQGVLYSFTRVHVAPAHWQTPYLVGYADFENDVRVFAKLDPEVDWAFGAPVRLRVQALADDGAGFHYFLGAA
jgi:uncharacterized OB-fold protein